MRKKKITRIHFLVLMVICIILFPWIKSIGTLPLLRPEWFVLIVGLASMPISWRVMETKVAHWAGFVFITYLASMIYGIIFIGVSIDVRDFTELLKPVLYFLFFLFIASGSYTIIEYRKFLRFSILAFALAALIAIIQFFNPSLIAPLLLIYRDDAAEIQSYMLLRAFGTMGNPNVLGILMTLGFALTLFTMKYRILPMTLTQVFLMMNFAGVFFSGSRTGIVCLSTVILLFIVLEVRKNAKSILLIIGLSFAAIWGFQNYLQDSIFLQGTIGRATTLGNISGDEGGWLPRVEMVKKTLVFIETSVIFGHGPGKALYIDIGNIDNEYMILLYRYGLLGTIATLGFIWLLVVQPQRFSTQKSPLLHSMRNYSYTTMVAAAIFAYTAGFFTLFPIFSLSVILWSVSSYLNTQDRFAEVVEVGQ